MSDARQILVALPTRAPGVSVPPPARLVGLSSSHTGEVRLQNVHVDRDWLIAGPVPEVMKQGVGAGTGGLQTSTLAVGLATTATNFLAEESVRRDDLREPAGALEEDLGLVRADLLAAADGTPACTSEQLRTRANSLALRAAEAALAAAKGTGYVVGHPAGRWCREALFFLVWSCPQSVMAANLCELAGIGVD
jgi:alkylation response protein AidB-like acyl-CoA dehydrogenase